jgi:IMP dehydrogenase
MDFKQTYSFDDILLVPQHSDIKSRAQVNIGNDLDSKTKLSLPVISSPMDTVTESCMANAMHNAGGLGIIHRYNSVEEQAALVTRCSGISVGAAIGMTGDFLDRASAVLDAGAQVLCVDVAHGHHSMMRECLTKLKHAFGDKIHIMAGNVATLEAFDALASWGADSIRVGIGGGSICSTRMVSGHGMPTFQSVLECSRTTYDTKIIADGGIKTTGDMVKALAAGADFVMVGSMLAGAEETPGDTFFGKGQKRYKVYRGMASKAAQNSWRGKSSTPEGVSTTVPYRGDTKDLLEDIAGGIRSGLSYSGVRNIKELQNRAEFIVQSNAAQLESNTHILWTRK